MRMTLEESGLFMATGIINTIAVISLVVIALQNSKIIRKMQSNLEFMYGRAKIEQRREQKRIEAEAQAEDERQRLVARHQAKRAKLQNE